ncbi:glutenin, high molecular weight subunit PW212-like [Anneissia japonica]|uniref:glutenin, high molecular weight subunit PW212-like n=1 Tax=Anneissia japonica TaxID=1529436 RepID=UPI001425AC56|nr:glutenin, high molecular weight subunit PW212-like [Anneissia japonica]
MNRYPGIFLMMVVIPMVFGVPLLNRVKRQNPEDTNELPDNYQENLGDQNQPDGQLADKINDVPDESPEQEAGAPMVGADNSPYRQYNMAPGYGDQEKSAVTGQEPNAPQDVPPQETMALPLDDASRSGQPVDLSVIPASGQLLNDAQGQYISGDGLTIPSSGKPAVEGELGPEQDINQNLPDGQIADQRYPTNNVPDESPEQQQPVASMVGADNSPYRKYNMAPGYGNKEQPVVTGQEPDSVQGVPPPGSPQGALSQTARTGTVPGVPSSGEPVQHQNQILGEYEPPQVPELEGLPQNQYEGNINSPYVPQVPEAGDVNQQYIPNAGQQMPGSGEPLPVQPQADSESPQNQQYYNPIAPSQNAGYVNPDLQPQAESGLPQNQNPGDLNQQYDNPVAPSQNAGYVNPDLQPQAESGLPQNQNPGDLNQQYYNPIAPSQNAGYVNPDLQPQAESGLPQNQNPGDLNQQYYNPIAPSPNAGYVNPDLQPQDATDSPNVNSTNQKTTIDYAYTGTETPDYWGWRENNYGDDDLYPNPDDYDDDLLNQYYPDKSENSYYSFDLFGNGNNLNDENKNQPIDNDVWDFESNGEEPFDPYESLDDESYQNILKQEEEDYKTFEEKFGGGNVPPKPFSPGDRLQPGIHTNWQLDNSHPSSTTVNPQAANNFLLYCIPAILLTLIIYVGYTNWIRKPKIVRIPSGNNWRAEYRDIEAKSREIEPMLRKAEMY